jgi:hypothetical protein
MQKSRKSRKFGRHHQPESQKVEKANRTWLAKENQKGQNKVISK